MNDSEEAIVSDIHIEDSAVTLIYINKVGSIAEENKRLLITNFTYENSYFKNGYTLFSPSNSEAVSKFEIILQNVTMSDLYFERTGNLFLFQQKSSIPFQLLNSYFSNITGGSIALKSQSTDSSNLLTKVIIVDMIVSGINNQQSTNRDNTEEINISNLSAFIINSEGGDLEIYNSSFSNMYNLKSGSVFNGNARGSIAKFFNSTFQNSSSLNGGIAHIEDGSKAIFYYWLFTHNFAIEGGIIKASNEGYFEIHRSTIIENYAMTAIIGDLFVVSSLWIINNSTIIDNYALNSEKMTKELKSWSTLWIIPYGFRYYLMMNPSLMDAKTGEFLFQSIIGNLEVVNSTVMQRQPQLFIGYLSNVVFNEAQVSQLSTNDVVIKLIEWHASISNSQFTGVLTEDKGVLMEASFGSYLNISSVSYENSNIKLLRSITSTIVLSDLIFENVALKNELLDFREGSTLTIKNVEMNNITTMSLHLISIFDSNLKLIEGLTISNVNSVAISFENSKVQNISSLQVTNASQGLLIENCEIELVQNSNFTRWGSTNQIEGGGVNLIDSNSTFLRVIFDQNTAIHGGAISIKWANYFKCENSILNSTFSNNIAIKEGGAIYYNFKRPFIENIMFANNSALYGPNIANYAVRIIFKDKPDQSLVFSNVVSGQSFPKSFTFQHIDYDNQVMSLLNSGQIKITPFNNEARLTGEDAEMIANGESKFDNIIFTYRPGAADILFSLKSKHIDANKVSYLNLTNTDVLSVTFRFWMPGEFIEQTSKWVEWPEGTYSLHWNSTKCEDWMSHAVWLGGSRISVDERYWRNTLNSTEIISCPRALSCKGGYHPNNKHPVKCEKGYTGFLWAECDTSNGNRYERVSAYQWAHCPDLAMNLIRFILLLLVAFFYMLILVVVNIRKKKEHQTSILLRIFTNYFQLIVVAFSFNFNLPQIFDSSRNAIERIGSNSEVILSYDCLIKNANFKAFAPSTEIFKIIMINLLPIFLILVMAIFWITLYSVFKVKSVNAKRWIIISIVWIILLLHPGITKSTFEMFKWEKIDSLISKMKVHMDFEWWSSEHIQWVFLVAFPSIILWIIGMPLLAFIILFQNRHNLDKDQIKQYLMLLYQGLHKSVFYWEFINIFRKVILLILSVVVSSVSINYTAMFSIVILVLIGKAQLILEPYRNHKNNQLEMKAIIAGWMTLYCGVLFHNDEQGKYKGFMIMAVWLLIIYNVIFIIEWTYLFLLSFKDRGVTLNIVLQFLAAILLTEYNTFIHDNQLKREKDESNSEIEQGQLLRSRSEASPCSSVIKKLSLSSHEYIEKRKMDKKIVGQKLHWRGKTKGVIKRRNNKAFIKNDFSEK